MGQRRKKKGDNKARWRTESLLARASITEKRSREPPGARRPSNRPCGLYAKVEQYQPDVVESTAVHECLASWTWRRSCFEGNRALCLPPSPRRTPLHRRSSLAVIFSLPGAPLGSFSSPIFIAARALNAIQSNESIRAYFSELISFAILYIVLSIYFSRSRERWKIYANCFVFSFFVAINNCTHFLFPAVNTESRCENRTEKQKSRMIESR